MNVDSSLPNSHIHSHIQLGKTLQKDIQQWKNIINWNKINGMLPVIVQDIQTLQVLMQGFMNEKSLEQSLSCGKVTFYSRSKQRIWCKGETSGNFLLIRQLALDCDCDSLLILAEPCGPTCHNGCNSCYSYPNPDQVTEALKPLGKNFGLAENGQSLGVGWLGALERIVKCRHKELEKSEGKPSYVQQLFQRGVQRIAQKVGEEGVETALAAMALKAATKEQSPDLVKTHKTEVIAEAGDLLFHLIVLLQACDVNLQDVMNLLEQRHRNSISQND